MQPNKFAEFRQGKKWQRNISNSGTKSNNSGSHVSKVGPIKAKRKLEPKIMSPGPKNYSSFDTAAELRRGTIDNRHSIESSIMRIERQYSKDLQIRNSSADSVDTGGTLGIDSIDVSNLDHDISIKHGYDGHLKKNERHYNPTGAISPMASQADSLEMLSKIENINLNINKPVVSSLMIQGKRPGKVERVPGALKNAYNNYKPKRWRNEKSYRSQIPSPADGNRLPILKSYISKSRVSKERSRQPRMPILKSIDYRRNRLIPDNTIDHHTIDKNDTELNLNDSIDEVIYDMKQNSNHPRNFDRYKNQNHVLRVKVDQLDR